MSYEVMEIEREDEHGDRYGVPDTELSYAEMLARVQAIEEEETRKALEEALAKAKTEAALRKLICSCGSYTCGAIATFGHPVPLYQAEIEPLPSQYAKDARALSLKGGQ